MALFHPALLLIFEILPTCTFIPTCTIIRETKVGLKNPWVQLNPLNSNEGPVKYEIAKKGSLLYFSLPNNSAGWNKSAGWQNLKY